MGKTTTCIDCGTEYVMGERRGDSPHGYHGYYCSDCDGVARS